MAMDMISGRNGGYPCMLEWGLNQTKSPVVIRVPGIAAVARNAELLSDYGQTAKI